MLRLDWNALRSGDRILLHHNVDGTQRLVSGVVLTVTPAAGSNDLEVRVAGNRGQTIRPQRLHAHTDPIESDGHCWRCASLEPMTTTTKPRGA